MTDGQIQIAGAIQDIVKQQVMEYTAPPKSEFRHYHIQISHKNEEYGVEFDLAVGIEFDLPPPGKNFCFEVFLKYATGMYFDCDYDDEGFKVIQYHREHLSTNQYDGGYIRRHMMKIRQLDLQNDYDHAVSIMITTASNQPPKFALMSVLAIEDGVDKNIDVKDCTFKIEQMDLKHTAVGPPLKVRKLN